MWETTLDDRNVGCLNKFDGKVWCTAHYAQEEVVFTGGKAKIVLTPGKSYVFPGLRNNITYSLQENLTPEDIAAGYQLRYYETNDGQRSFEPYVEGGLSDAFCNIFCVNSLTPPVEVVPTLQKNYITVVGEKPLAIQEGLFKFALVAKEGNPDPDPVSAELVASTDTTGKVTWPPLEFKSPGQWVYFITEVDPQDRLIEWDKGQHILIVDVSEDDNYQLHASVTYDDGESLEITNKRINYSHIPFTGGSGITATLQAGAALLVLRATGIALGRHGSRKKAEDVQPVVSDMGETKAEVYQPKHLAKK